MRKQRTLSRSKELWAYAFLAVPIVFYVVVRFYPSIFAFYLSLTDWDIVSRDKGFVGFENYARLFSDSVFCGRTSRANFSGLLRIKQDLAVI